MEVTAILMENSTLQIEQCFDKKYNAIKKALEKIYPQKINYFKNLILEDPDFKNCVTEELRNNYMLLFMEKYPELENYLLSGYLYEKKYMHPTFFIYQVWKELYKKNLHK